MAIAKSGKIHEDSGKNKVNFGEIRTSWMILMGMGIETVSLFKMNNLHPEKLNEHPYNMLVYNNHFGIIATVGVAMVLLFYGKSKNKLLRKEALKFLCQNIDVGPEKDLKKY